MRRDTRKTGAAGDVESLEDLVYRPRLATGNKQVRSANSLIVVPVTLLGYLALGFIGWQVVQHSKTLHTEIPKSVAVDLLDASEGDAPQATAPAPPPAAAGPPPGAIEKPDAPPPPIPTNTDAVPEQQPTELPTQDLSDVAFPTQPLGGPSGIGTGSGPVAGGTGEGTGTSGLGQGSKVVDLEYSDAMVLLEPKVTSANYPKLAYSARIQGAVEVELVVGTNGVPTSARALVGPRMLRPAGESIAMQYRFKPEIQNGVPVMTRFSIKIIFRIN